MPGSKNRARKRTEAGCERKKNLISIRHSDQDWARGGEDVNHSDYMDLVMRAHAWCDLEGTRPQEAGGGGRRHLFMLLHTAQRQSGEGVSVCFTPELANFCDGTFICGIQNDTVMRFCLFVRLFVFISPSWHLIFRRNQILNVTQV